MNAVTFYRFKDALTEGDFDTALDVFTSHGDVVYGLVKDRPLVTFSDNSSVFDWLLDHGCDPLRQDPRDGSDGVASLIREEQFPALMRLVDRFGVDVLRAHDTSGQVVSGPSAVVQIGLRPGVLELCIAHGLPALAKDVLSQCPQLILDRPVSHDWRTLDFIEASQDMLTTKRLPRKNMTSTLMFNVRMELANQLHQLLLRTQAAMLARQALSDVATQDVSGHRPSRLVLGCSHGW